MINFFKHYLEYYKNYKLKFFYVIIGIILVALGTSGTAYIIKPLLDDVFINKDTQMLAIIPIFVILLYMAKGFGRYIQAYYVSYIGQDIIRIVRDKLLAHLLKLDLAFFTSKHTGELISRITNDINRIQAAISNQIAKIIQESLTIVALVAVVIYQSPTLAFYGLVILPLSLYPLTLLAKKMKKLSFSSQEKNSDILSHLSEIFANIEIIKAYNANDKELKIFEQHNKDFFNINIKAIKTNELVSPVMEILGAIAIAIVITIGGKEVIDGNMSVGTFFSFMTALFMLYTPIKSLSSLYNKLQDALAANERINELFILKSNIISGNDKFETCEKIEFKNVQLKYDNKIALNDISFSLQKGDVIALVGDSGGGKSSLVNVLMRFYDMSSGNILINNIDINKINIKNFRSKLSIVTQRTYIFNSSIANNVSYGEVYDEQKVIDALKLSHAYDFVKSMENGIHTILDESGANLSGGQKQRITIARALYKQPEILILDEATSALDNESEVIITDVMNEVSNNKITFIIAHRLSTIKNANKIAVFKAGKMVCIGSDSELLDSCEEYKRLNKLI